MPKIPAKKLITSILPYLPTFTERSGELSPIATINKNNISIGSGFEIVVSILNFFDKNKYKVDSKPITTNNGASIYNNVEFMISSLKFYYYSPTLQA